MRKQMILICQVLICLLCLGLTSLHAQVILPESGRLAGPMNSEMTANGNEFLNFPWPNGPAARTFQSGWVEIQFGDPDGDLVPFQIFFDGRGSDTSTTFTTGQTMIFTEEVIFSTGSAGTLNLQTGEVEAIFVSLGFENSIISIYGRLNRLFATLGQDYPPSDAFVPPGAPPGFVFAEARFILSDEGRITGFEFNGASTVPVGFLGFLPFLPRYSFGPGGQAFFSNPAFCADSTPLAECPTDATNPDGLPLDPSALVRPNATIFSDELREVPVEQPIPSCAPFARADAVVATLDGKIYQIGGSGRGMERGRVDIYDPATGAWEEGPKLRVGVIDAQAATVDGKIYVYGGRRLTRSPAVNLLQIYDPSTETWSFGSPGPRSVADGVAVEVDGQLYVLSGLTNRPNGSPSGNLRFYNNVQIYDPSRDFWDQAPAFFNGEQVYLTGAAGVSYDGKIYLINGMTPDQEITPQVLVYDTTTRTFEQGVPTPNPRYEASAIRVGKRIFLAGGRASADGPSLRGVQVFETELDIWKQARDQPSPIAASAGAEVAGVAYFLGGRAMTGTDTFPGTESGVVQAFDPGRGWQACDSYPIYTSGDVYSSAGLAASDYILSPGHQASIDGSHLSANETIAPPNFNIPTTLSGISVIVDGQPAPVLSVAPDRVDFQVPYGVRTGRKVSVQVVRADKEEAPAVEVPVADVAPRIFVQSCNRIRDLIFLEGAAALACHVDESLNYGRNTVSPGDTLILQMSGLGAIDTELADGERTPRNQVVNALALPQIRVEGEDGTMLDAVVQSAVLAPGEVGIYDVSIIVPDNARVGNRVKIETVVDGQSSNPATISVGRLTDTDVDVSCLRDTNPGFRLCAPVR